MRRKATGPRGSHAGSRLRAARRGAVLALGLLVLATVQSVLLALRLPWAWRFPMAMHRLCRYATGLKLRRFGAPETDGPVLYVSNHVSYLDIAVLGSLLQAKFVSKAEVARWPVIGFLGRLQETVFIDRRAASAGRHLAALQGRLAAGDNMILFPEGTSSDGHRVLPFKGALFRAAAAEYAGRPVRVQPVTIAYSRLDGLPMGRGLRPYFAWYGDMTLPGHLWTCVGMGRPGVDVVFHPSVTLGEFASHTELARHCQAEIAAALSAALAGRLPDGDARDGMSGEDIGVDVTPVFSL